MKNLLTYLSNYLGQKDISQYPELFHKDEVSSRLNVDLLLSGTPNLRQTREKLTNLDLRSI
jgi:hypothetical protein